VQHRREFHPHESGWQMWVPLVVLGFASIVGGALNLPMFHWTKHLEHWLEPVLEGNEHVLSFGGGTLIVLAAVAVVGALLGIVVARAMYLQGKGSPALVEQPLFAKGWFYDIGITNFMGGPGRRLFELFAWFDRTIIDGAVNGVTLLLRRSSGQLRRVQTGLVRSYAVGVAAGAVLLVGYFITRASF
jgi:NADH-quinone oxidoreductase subunit L